MRFRRRAGGKKSHGALWSIIYIDLMTQIMAFFVIVWSVEHGAKLTQTPSLGTGVGMGDHSRRVRVVFGDDDFHLGARGRETGAPFARRVGLRRQHHQFAGHREILPVERLFGQG